MVLIWGFLLNKYTYIFSSQLLFFFPRNFTDIEVIQQISVLSSRFHYDVCSKNIFVGSAHGEQKRLGGRG